MDYLIAEIIKRGSGDKTFKIFSDEEVYSLPNDLDNPKEYNPDYKLEDDEWFNISDFSTTDYCIDLLTKDFNPTEYNQISTENLLKIKYLCSHQTNNNIQYYCFQKIFTSNIIDKKWFKFSNTPSLETKSPIVIVSTVPDAIYKKSTDTLYFKKLTSISTIFKGISELYKEATQEETETFLDNDFIKLEEGYEANKVGTLNRKRIALAIETLNSFTSTEKTHIYSYIKSYCTELPFNETDYKFTLKSEDDLKKLLWGIEQRYYTTGVGSEKRIANSISKVKKIEQNI
ncbi:hypothetical protein F7647_10355 [Tenacibaculum piscium]|uniref:hypothetical protein n=1 Tax=Tenacibaculum piscium TaxID=1458515 RepID=UPI00187B43C4|nr:hypothetical protein [Tenacibaculum piscium]MBE7671689.1 hypothetical protein [Tenacibaculum piscium]MBE7686449.1 hypothetical protein [Tenacibaculum piscium]